jgi:hypothetical protein
MPSRGPRCSASTPRMSRASSVNSRCGLRSGFRLLVPGYRRCIESLNDGSAAHPGRTGFHAARPAPRGGVRTVRGACGGATWPQRMHDASCRSGSVHPHRGAGRALGDAKHLQIARIPRPQDVRFPKSHDGVEPDRVAPPTCQPWRSTSARRAGGSPGAPCPSGRTRCPPARAAAAAKSFGYCTRPHTVRTSRATLSVGPSAMLSRCV